MIYLHVSKFYCVKVTQLCLFNFSNIINDDSICKITG